MARSFATSTSARKLGPTSTLLVLALLAACKRSEMGVVLIADGSVDALITAEGGPSEAKAPVDAAAEAGPIGDVGSMNAVDPAADTAIASPPDVADVPAEAPGGLTSDGPANDLPPGPAKLDLLFMIDDSSSMTSKQEKLRAAFPTFMQAILGAQRGPLDLHLGIVSSNVGSGPTAAAANCPPGGDRGRFQVRPNCGLDPVTAGSFLTMNAASGSSNFAGGPSQLPEVFSCLAALGTAGCGYEHQLLSVYLALDGRTNPENVGFARDDAVLGIVLLSDEDDCSGLPNADFYADPIAGQSGSVRCSLRGHLCNGQPVPAMPFSAPLSACAAFHAPSQTPSTLINVETFVDDIKSLAKNGHEERLFVASIMGWDDAPTARYTIVSQPRGGGEEIDTGPICQDPQGGSATPGLRLHAFARSFAHNGVYSICGDLGVAMADIGAKLASLLPPSP